MSEPLLGAVVPDTRLHPIYLIINTAKTLRQAIPYLLVTIFGGAPWWVSASLFGVVMIIAATQWLMKKYSVVGGVLLLRSGIVNHTVQVVPLTRITALEASQSLAQRLVGVWGLAVHSPGDHYGSALSLACLSGSRLDELRAALGSVGRTGTRRTRIGLRPVHDRALPGMAANLGGVCTWPRRTGGRGVDQGRDADRRGDQLRGPADLHGCAGVWFRFAYLLPERAADVMEIVAPQGLSAVLITLVAVALAVSAVRAALWWHRFTLIRDGDVLRIHRGLLGRQSAIIPVNGFRPFVSSRDLGARCWVIADLQVEIAGIGRVNVKQRMLFPLVRADRAEALIRRALPELPWPSRAAARAPGTGAPPLSHHSARIRDGLRAADADPARSVEAPGGRSAAPGLPARRRPGARGPMGGRRPVRGVPLEAATSEPQHGHRSSRRCPVNRVLQLPEEGQEACRRLYDEVLLRAARADALHGRVRCTPAAADGRPRGITLRRQAQPCSVAPGAGPAIRQGPRSARRRRRSRSEYGSWVRRGRRSRWGPSAASASRMTSAPLSASPMQAAGLRGDRQDADDQTTAAARSTATARCPGPGSRARRP